MITYSSAAALIQALGALLPLRSCSIPGAASSQPPTPLPSISQTARFNSTSFDKGKGGTLQVQFVGQPMLTAFAAHTNCAGINLRRATKRFDHDLG